MGRIVLVVILVLLTVLVVARVMTRSRTNALGQREIEAVPIVEAAMVTRGDVERTLTLLGKVHAGQEVDVFPKVTGKVARSLVKEGQSVAQGAVLFEIDRDEVGFDFALAPVESPIRGVVGRLWVDPGERVSPGTRMATVVNLSATKVIAQAIEQDLPFVASGQEAEVRVGALSPRQIPGRVTQVSPIVDDESQTAPVEIAFNEHIAELRPGMLARATLTAERREDVLTMPYQAMVREDGRRYVFVVIGDTVSARDVVTGLEGVEIMEVVSGLSEGERVVTVGQARLQQGSRVRISGEEKDQ
jgi:membrane fusion protein (multidrug efflux system)